MMPEASAPNSGLVPRPIDHEILEKVLIGGNLAELSPAARLEYYRKVCESLGLNPVTRPFAYIVLDDRLVLYALRDATDQLRRLHGITIEVKARETTEDGLYVVTATAIDREGRRDEAIGAVPLVREGGQWKTSGTGKRYFETDGTTRPLTAIDRANGIMRAETKAKRRVTLSICGLGMLDESELDAFVDAPTSQARRGRPAVPIERGGAELEPPADAPNREALFAESLRLSELLKLDARVRAALWEQFCPGAGPDNVAPAALDDLNAELRKRAAAKGLLL